MQAPQIIMICWMSIGFTVAITRHGKPREGKDSAFMYLIGASINLGLLIWGGFFK